MVNLLETLYALTALSAFITFSLWIMARGSTDVVRSRRRARRWTILTAICALGSVILYIYLSARSSTH
jgi:hypothetical protein